MPQHQPKPLYPRDLLKAGQLDQLVPDLATRPELFTFLANKLPHYSTPEQKELRRQARAKFLEHAGKSAPGFNCPVIKMVLFDVDETLGHLYLMANEAGAWSLNRLAQRHDLPIAAIRAAVKTIPGEYICHSPHELMIAVAVKLDRPEFHPANNPGIMSDWHDARDVLNLQWHFRDVLPTFMSLHNKGAKIYLATSSMPASLIHRLFLWLGDKHIDLVDGIAVRETLRGDGAGRPDIPARNALASQAEKEFAARLEKAGKIISIPEDKIKPDPEHLRAALRHANAALRAAGGEPIRPEECLLIDDSPKYGAAASVAGMYFAHTIKAIPSDPKALTQHVEYGCPKGHLGLEALIRHYDLCGRHKPDIIIKNLSEIFSHFEIKPARENCLEQPPAVSTHCARQDGGSLCL